MADFPLYARAQGSRDRIEKVEVGGSAVVVARGEFRLDIAPPAGASGPAPRLGQ